MKKEKTVRTYQRKTKSGKVVTVRQHKATYDAADKSKEISKKKGAGSELADKKLSAKELKQMNDILKENGELDEKYLEAFYPEVSEKVRKAVMKEYNKKGKSAKESKPSKAEKPKTDSTKTSKKAETKSSELPFTAAEFKEWYQGTGSETDKKVAKALRKQLGAKGYRKLEDEAIDNYTPRGHNKMFKSLSAEHTSTEPKTSTPKTETTSKSKSKEKSEPKISINDYSKITNKALQRKITKYVQEATNWEYTEDASDYTWKDTLRALSEPAEIDVRENLNERISGKVKWDVD